MAKLSNATLSIPLVSGTNTVDVTATVVVKLDPVEEALVKTVGLAFKLRCTIFGSDDGFFTGADDRLFSIHSQTIKADGTYKFHRKVSRDVLDEDWGNDEVYAHFTLQSNSPIFQLNPPAKANSAVIAGNF